MRRGNVRPGRPADAGHAGAGWHRQPVAWLAALLLLASLAAVVATIVVAARFPDDTVPAAGARVLKTPVSREADPPPAAATDPTE